MKELSLQLFGQLLPRHLEIIYEINRRFLEELLTRFPHDDSRLNRMSLIDESGERYVRMAHLATVAGRNVNGVAQLHSNLLKRTVLQDFAELWPEKFCNVTNGVSPRRFLAMTNPGLAELITTIGTLDGANVEIRGEVGADNFFLFGLDAEQVGKVKSQGYRPRDHYEQNAMLREVLDFMASWALAGGDAKLFQPLVENLLRYDPFLLLTDYQPYIDCQDQVSALWCNPAAWTRKSILTVARMGKFSSDRSIREYGEQIWNVIPSSVEAA